MTITAIIPARLAASRLPGKPLADIGGTPMVVHTLRAALHHPDIDDAVVATDHPDIAAAVTSAGGRALLTGEHPSGTDRCHDAWKQLGRPAGAIINLQGDEPFPEAAHLTALCQALRKGVGDVITLRRPAEAGEPGRPERVKVHADPSGRALAFSRTAMPSQGPHFIHLGLYGFGPQALSHCAQLPQGRLEQLEKLEQLRWLEAGVHIQMVDVTASDHPGSVDTPEDLERVRNWWAKQVKT